MMAPLPNPSPPPAPHESPRVRLEVRTGGRPTTHDHEIATDEFLIGGAAGCDLRLAVANLPPVVCQLTRGVNGVLVRRVASGLPVLLNGALLPPNVPTPVSHDDRLTIAGVEIAVSIERTVLLTPKLVPLDPYEELPAPAAPSSKLPDLQAEVRRLEERKRDLEDQEAARREAWSRREADLTRRQRELDAQTQDLEADRVAWYQRRQELEQELARPVGTSPAPRGGDLAVREQELATAHEELEALRDKLVREHQERRDQLDQAQDLLRTATARLQEDRQAFEAEAEERRARLDEEFRQKRAAFALESAGRTTQLEAEVLDRYRAKLEDVDRFQGSLRESAARLGERQKQFEAEAAARLFQADEEIARRRAAFEAELTAHQARVEGVREQEARLAAAFQELTRQRESFAADRDILARSRETFEAEKAAETDRLGAWEKVLAGRESELTRRETVLATDRESFDRDRRQLNDDLLRLDRRRAEADDRDREHEARVRDADVQLEQLRRDAAEWEETLRLAAAEQERLRAEADRLDRQRADLDTQTARLAERAAQLESQQGTLALLRAKLDRTREEVEREAAALAAARMQEDAAQAELRARIREAEELRAQLGTEQQSTALQRRGVEERNSLLVAELNQIRQQKDALAADDARLREREAALDVRAAEFAEQAGALKGRTAQALDLQARLEADRVALREREAALAQAEDARQALQEQLRRRAEDLTARARTLDELTRQLATDRTALDQAKAATEAERTAGEGRVAALQQDVEARAADVERHATTVAEREAALGRQVERLKEVGQAVATERKSLTEARAKWEADRAAAEADARRVKDELEAFRTRATADIDALRAQAPELEDQARAALDRLTAAKDVLRGHLTELHDFARQNRDDLEAVRAQVRAEADRLREREAVLDRARAEHRLSVTEFRQQLVEWQGTVATMRQALARGETRLDEKQAAVAEAARQVDATTQQLAEQAEQLRREREEVVQRRTEVERHLADMREWYRKKLRELAEARAAGRGATGAGPDEPPFSRPRLADLPETDAAPPATAPEDLDPGDRQLGELLRSLDLVDADALAALWAEAGRQRRTLRQVLLASGVITLYQLALIEAGNLDALVLGRFRVIDRLRATPREAIYRVLDPTRLDARSGGVLMLRHLSEAEAQDAVHPDEFRQRFAAARSAAHPNLAAVVEVAEINGRPAMLQEWLTGLFSADWPPHAAHPGCWVRLMTMAAEGIEAAHRTGLTHGRLTADSFVLTAGGVLKVTGFGEPPWLAAGPEPMEASPAADLRMLGQVAFGWSQLAAARKRAGVRAKAFPADLAAVIRRLEAEPEPPMADTVAADRPYTSATELVADLKRVARETPFSDDAWEKLLRHVAEHAPDGPAALRQSA